MKQSDKKGALVGIELDESSGGARRYCERIAERGVLCKETRDFVIRLAPPLVIDEADLLRGVDVIVDTIEELGSGKSHSSRRQSDGAVTA